MATKADTITAVRAYLASHLAGLGDLTDEASKDGTAHYLHIGQDYTLVLSRDLLDLGAESVIARLHGNQVVREVREDGKGHIVFVDSSGTTRHFAYEEWERRHPS